MVYKVTEKNRGRVALDLFAHQTGYAQVTIVKIYVKLLIDISMYNFDNEPKTNDFLRSCHVSRMYKLFWVQRLDKELLLKWSMHG